MQSQQVQQLETLLGIKFNEDDKSGDLAYELDGWGEIKSLTITNRRLTDMSFAENFPELIYLNLSNNDITELSLRKLQNLTHLELRNNKIGTILDLRNLTRLEFIDLSFNQIEGSVYLKSMYYLGSLILNNNRIKELTLIDHHVLNKILIANNPLKSILLTNLPDIRRLDLNSLSLKDIKILQLDSLYDINLSNNKISDVSFLNTFKNLVYANLEGNNITKIQLTGLQRLKQLHISNNPVISISLNNLPRIDKIDFSNIGIESLTITEIPYLHTLILRNTRLHDFSFLQNVKNVTFLDLSNIGFEYIDLKGLNNLDTLHLQKNRIKNPSFLKHLPRLKDLDLDLNPIADYSPLLNLPILEVLKVSNDIPAHVLKNSTYLKEIYLSGVNQNDQLTRYLSDRLNFPNLRTIGQKSEEIVELENAIDCKLSITFPGSVFDMINNATYSINSNSELDSLFIRRLSLYKIDFVTKFKKIEKLDLRLNRIEDISAIKGLSELKELHLYQNSIKDIPLDFFDGLPKLEYLNIKGNPIHNVPKELFDNDKNVLNEVKTYINSLKGEKEYLHQAKLILIGNGEVGKSSIRLKLLDKKSALPNKEDRTKGLDIDTYKIKGLSPQLTKLEEPIDFSLAIWDFGGQGRYREVQQLFCSRKALYIFVTSIDDLPTNEDYVGFEYWLSMAKAFGYDQRENWQSPIIHVVNKCDLGKRPINEESLSQVFDNIHEYVKISCETLLGFNLLEDTIRTALPKVSKDIFLNQFSKKWFEVKTILEEMRYRNHITLVEYEDICRREGLNQAESELWLDYLDRIGELIYFRDNVDLNNFIVLNPLWVKDSIYKVLDSPLTQKGMLEESWFPFLWSDYNSYEHLNLLAIMNAYKFCYQQKNSHGQIYFIIPALLPANPPLNTDQAFQYQHGLRFDYKPFIPAGTVNKLIVVLKEYIYQDLKWKNGCVIHLKEDDNISYAEIIEDWEKRAVFVRIGGFDLHGIYNLIRRTLSTLLEDLKKIKFLEVLESEIKVKVNDHYVEPKTIISLGRENSYRFLFKSDKPSITPKSNTVTNLVVKTVNIFLASSSELQADRDSLRIFISVENDRLHEKGIYLKIIQWEYFLDAISNTNLQNEYNKAVKDCDIVISLFYTKAGKYTIEEFETAYARFKETGKPLIYTYLKNGSVNMNDINENVITLFNFKARLKEIGHFPTTYNSIEDLKLQLKGQLEKILENYFKS